MAYRYPTTEAVTDPLEQAADPYKRRREMAMLQAMMSFSWERALDFGCGVGRNFPLFTTGAGPSSSLLAIDRDEGRLKKAREAACDLSSSNIKITYATGLDHEALSNESFDLILACQVFTHCSTVFTNKTLTVLSRILRPKGVLVICVPFHIGCADGDYFHTVALASRNGMIQRTTISEEEFNAFADNPPSGMLPVRAFEIELAQPVSSLRYLPSVSSIPKAFAAVDGLRPQASYIYSVHEFDDTRPLIGDIALKLIKS